MAFIKHPCKKKVIENPVGIMSSIYRKPDQYIQPYEYGDDAINAKIAMDIDKEMLMKMMHSSISRLL